MCVIIELGDRHCSRTPRLFCPQVLPVWLCVGLRVEQHGIRQPGVGRVCGPIAERGISDSVLPEFVLCTFVATLLCTIGRGLGRGLGCFVRRVRW